jgi:hypothetical protein
MIRLVNELGQCPEDNYKGPVMDLQILRCINQARTSSDSPVGLRLKTSMSQLLDIDPDGPNSSMAVTIRPVVQRMNMMKPPIMTMAGSKRRFAISQKRNMMKQMSRHDTVMK